MPNKTIRINTLMIKKPITILGSPTSMIEIYENILIDLTKWPKLNKKVLLSQCNICFNHSKRFATTNNSMSTKSIKILKLILISIYLITVGSKESEEFKNFNKKNYSINNLTGQITTEINNKSQQNSLSEDKIYPLFTIYPNSILELRDCNLKSENYIDHQIQASHLSQQSQQSQQSQRSSLNSLKTPLTTIQDVCFFLKYPLNKEYKEGAPQCGLTLQSCVLTNFWTCIQNTRLSLINIEKSYLSNSKCHALNISNPLKLAITESVIEKSNKSCINIRFSKGIDKTIQRYIIIENNDFNKSMGYGISIFGENTISHLCKILIKNNRITQCLKDGIGVKNLNIDELEITLNDINNNKGNGIYLQNILDSLNFTQVRLSENKISQSQLYGFTIIDVSCYSEKDEIFQNEKGGIILTGGDKINTLQEANYYKSFPIRNIFNSCSVNNNNDSGIIISAPLKGPLIMNTCEISENTNGIYIRQKLIDDLTTRNSSNNSNPNSGNRHIQSHNFNALISEPLLGQIVLEKCSILQNKASGIQIKSITDKLYVIDSIIHENKMNALYLTNEEDKTKLVFKDADKGRLREYVTGFIGGEWGILFEEPNTTTCKANKCNIF